jgi:hypothetical protein
VASLDLKAAIIGTYVLDPDWIEKEFPVLFSDRVNGDNDSTERKRAKMDEELTPTLPILADNTNKFGRVTSLGLRAYSDTTNPSRQYE